MRVCLMLLFLVLSPALCGAGHAPRVLLLSSYHPGFPTFFTQVEGVKQTLDAKGVELDVEFMDSKRFYTKENLANFTRLLQYKIENTDPFDVLIVADDNALVYACEHRENLFKGIPIVFLGVNNVDYAMAQVTKHGLTGVIEGVSIEDNVQLIHKLIPSMKSLFVIADATLSGQSDLLRFKQTMQTMNDRRYTLLDLSMMRWADFPAMLRRINPGQAVLLLSAYRDMDGLTKTFEESLKIIRENSPCPVFHLWSHGIGSGLIGGKVISFMEQGRLAAELALEIINGASPSSLPVIASDDANIYMFDSPTLRHFGLETDLLPDGTTLLHHKPSFFTEHSAVIIEAGAIILLLIFVITYLLKVNQAKAEAEHQLRASEEKYRAYIQAAPDAVFVCDIDGTIVQINPAVTRLTGFTDEELVGSSFISTLVPPERRNVALQGLLAFQDRETFSTGMELIRKDGDRVYVLLDIVKLADNTLLGFFKDITEDKRTHDALEESELRFRVLLEQAGDAIFANDMNGQFQFVNAAACESLGYTREELLQLKVWEVDPLAKKREDPETFWAQPSVAFESLHRHKDGSVFPVEVKMERISVAGEAIILCLARDLTDRKAAENRMTRESQINLAQAEIVRAMTVSDGSIKTISDVVYGWTRTLTGSEYVYVGSLSSDGSGLIAHSITAMSDGSCLDTPVVTFRKEGEMHLSLLGHSMNTRESFYTNAVSEHPESTGVPDGHFTVEQFLSVPCIFEGELIGQIGVANPGRDFVDEDLKAVEALAGLFALAVFSKRTESELIEAKETAECANRSKSEFLANISHELRTPINAMFGMLALVKTTHLSDEQSDYVTTAIESGNNLLQVINDILDISKVEAGKIELEMAPFSPRELIAAVVSIFRFQAQDKELEMEWHVTDAVDEAVVGDAGRLRQILLNLVGNAIKFTASGSIVITCDVLNTPSSSEFVKMLFSVKDTGIGIPSDKISSIFNAFEQVDGSYSRRYQGTGLGLGIVKRFVELMGGTITVESQEGLGTTIAATVKMRQCQPGQMLHRVKENAMKIDITGLRLLLAEDDRVNRIAASRLLEKRGFVVKAVQDGQEVLDALAADDYDCILMDVQMPGMDGLEATAAIRVSPELGAKRDIPIVALTAHAMKGDRENFIAAGMDEYLSKPMDMDKLEKVLVRVLTKKSTTVSR